MRKRVRTILSILLFAALAATLSADVPATLSGDWVGTIDVHDTGSGNVVSTTVHMSLTQRDSAIAGKIGREGESDEAVIQNARIEGDKFYFEATNPDVSGPIKFALTRQGDQMQGEMKASLDSGEIVGVVKVSRQKK